MAKPIPKRFGEIVKRYEGNPIITRDNVDFDCAHIFNAGAIKYRDNCLLLLRVQARDKKSHLVKATSEDGINFKIPNKYAFSPSRNFRLDDKGVEDPRITRMDGLYFVTYTAYSTF